MLSASALRRISVSHSPMASKPQPHRLHQLAGTTALQSSAKRARTMSTESSSTTMKDAFAKYADYLNHFSVASEHGGSCAVMILLLTVLVLNEKRERVIKASRDITINSKKVIFQVHRMSRLNKEEVLEKAEKDLAAVINQYISRLVKELQGTDHWKLRRAYSPGVQEYIEAATFCKFCRTGTLLNLEEINATFLPLSDPSLEPLKVNVLDYLLGLADLTGELMRLAIGRISDGEFEYAEKICRFVRDIYRELTILFPLMDDNSDMKMKMDTMLQSVVKIENGILFVVSIPKVVFMTMWIIIGSIMVSYSKTQDDEAVLNVSDNTTSKEHNFVVFYGNNQRRDCGIKDRRICSTEYFAKPGLGQDVLNTCFREMMYSSFRSHQSFKHNVVGY
ncbi:hypothetical protein EZV62_018003 [Acer yangbiense]|uniref:Translin-associated protein X n=1 Tax=Acer yangbiense TaxID=1000413 RepID=A0A5C7HI22_9ROSI|nr:hypothetical protein EZV62_018003 [Acer yangbiense]